MLGELLLRHSDKLSKILQSPHITAAEGQKFAAMTVKTLKSVREDENFQALKSTENCKSIPSGESIIAPKAKSSKTP